MADFQDMIHLAVNSKASQSIVIPSTPECIKRTSKRSKIPVLVLKAFKRVEGAKSGHIRINTNGSYDVGEFQINSINWPMLYQNHGITPVQLRYNGCISVKAGALLIRQHLDATNVNTIHSWDQLFTLLANYHSKTPEHNKTYKNKLMAALHQTVMENE